MATVGIKELKAHTTDILLRVRNEGEPIDITLRGEVVARIVPIAAPNTRAERTQHAQATLKQIAADIRARGYAASDVQVIMDEERR